MLRETKNEITYKGENYPLVFNLNVMERIQEEFGTVEKWGELTDGESGEVNVKALLFGLAEMINEGLDIENEEKGTNRPFISHKKAGRMLTDLGIENVAKTANDLVIESTKDDSKNA